MSSSYLSFRKQEQELRAQEKLTGKVENLCIVKEPRFVEVVCDGFSMPVEEYYKFLFSCFLFTVGGDQFVKSSIREYVTEHFDARICGKKCEFTLQESVVRKQPRDGIVLIRFPHKAYHKGRRVKEAIVETVLAAVFEHIPEFKVDLILMGQLKQRIAKYAY